MKILQKKPTIKLNNRDKRLVYAMQTLGDKTRFKIFKLLLTQDELCVSEIAERLDVSVPAVSQHFRTFELVGLVDKDRAGQKVCYCLKADDLLVKELTSIVLKNK